MAEKEKPVVINDAMRLYRGAKSRERKAAALKLGKLNEKANRAIAEAEAQEAEARTKAEAEAEAVKKAEVEAKKAEAETAKKAKDTGGQEPKKK